MLKALGVALMLAVLVAMPLSAIQLQSTGTGREWAAYVGYEGPYIWFAAVEGDFDYNLPPADRQAAYGAPYWSTQLVGHYRPWQPAGHSSRLYTHDSPRPVNASSWRILVDDINIDPDAQENGMPNLRAMVQAVATPAPGAINKYTGELIPKKELEWTATTPDGRQQRIRAQINEWQFTVYVWLYVDDYGQSGDWTSEKWWECCYSDVTIWLGIKTVTWRIEGASGWAWVLLAVPEEMEYGRTDERYQGSAPSYAPKNNPKEASWPDGNIQLIDQEGLYYQAAATPTKNQIVALSASPSGQSLSPYGPNYVEELARQGADISPDPRLEGEVYIALHIDKLSSFPDRHTARYWNVPYIKWTFRIDVLKVDKWVAPAPELPPPEPPKGKYAPWEPYGWWQRAGDWWAGIYRKVPGSNGLSAAAVGLVKALGLPEWVGQYLGPMIFWTGIIFCIILMAYVLIIYIRRRAEGK